ncbi:DNA polymerase III subunit chi [Altererythrobacter sp. B11]|uniref:DNA polymerase III subunit chi n=1 Tax=Altererythrobacter sp. B11 TaxID=2060312 RepID=UPI000DC73450|nr:DNA polymerase III subunit chi [Altererythrobacter sp. B11]BBC72574.1 DNA polymerase III subunit chi [Altererythrobacter sp. B11]
MQVDFYQLADQPVENHLPQLARKVLDTGGRMVVVSGDEGQLGRISEALWVREEESFLANGRAGEAHETRQPILLSAQCAAPNGARFAALADGQWREEAGAFDRVFLMFGDDALQGARACWKMLGSRTEVERRFWKLDGGRWRPGP